MRSKMTIVIITRFTSIIDGKVVTSSASSKYWYWWGSVTQDDDDADPEDYIGSAGGAEDCLLSSVHKTPSSWWKEGKRDYSGRPNPPPTSHPTPKKGYHLVNWKKMVASVERGKSYQEQAVEGGMHHCPAVGSPTRTEKPQNPEIKSSRCCSRDLLENLRGGRGRERGRRRGGIPLPTVEPPSTVELTGVHCGAHPASESLTPARHILHRPIPPASIPHQRSNRFKQPILCWEIPHSLHLVSLRYSF